MNLDKLFLYCLKFKQKLFPRFCRPSVFNRILELEGFVIGNGTVFYSPNSITIDRERPWMLEIGQYCKITKGVIILTHDYSRSVLRRVYGDVVGEAGRTMIGNNVFIGMNSIVLMGAQIGNNVIIGAGSVVGGKIPDNVVVAGNPARVLRSLDEHYVIRKAKFVSEAKLYALSYYKKYGVKPTVGVMNSFFPLYLQRSLSAIEMSGLEFQLNGD